MLKDDGCFYCMNFLDSFRTKHYFGSHKKVCENKDFGGVVIPFEGTKILEFNQYRKHNKNPSIIHTDL